METRYVSFSRGRIAVVEMVNRPPFFEAFAASIRHEDLAGGGSVATYKLRFVARPRFLRWVLHPVMALVLRVETRKRLAALAGFLEG